MKLASIIAALILLLGGCASLMDRGGPEDSHVSGAPAVTSNPDEAKIITSDIDNFWRALDLALPSNDYRVYRDEYLLPGSPGLKEFSRLKIGGPRILAMKVSRNYDYYASIRKQTSMLPSQFGRIRESYRELKKMYPEARFPSVYFVIGSMTSGGIAANRGLEIGTELFAKGPTSPIDELNRWEQTAVQPIDKIPAVVAHELIHYQQQYPIEPKTLLERSIVEGSADFLAELITGGTVNVIQHRFGVQHEAALWAEFVQAMNGTDYSRWLYNGASVAQGEFPPGRPADLGYFIGYRITQAYYDRAADKEQAIRAILSISDFKRFCTESGYGVTVATKR
jgi:hypothetical protein